jgi:hypothetical protein
MAEEFGKMKCKTISLESFLLYKFRKHNTAVRTKHDISKEIVSYKLGNL